MASGYAFRSIARSLLILVSDQYNGQVRAPLGAIYTAPNIDALKDTDYEMCSTLSILRRVRGRLSI